MSKIFCCGSFGCNVIVIDDKAQDYAKEERLKWVKEHKRKKGDFSPIEEQEEYIEATYNRFRNIKLLNE